MKSITLTNTLNRKKEVFQPIKQDQVSLYVCGITPYDYAHLGHGRSYVNFDVLVRLLKILQYKVTYVRNFTDIDDKIINKASKEGSTPTAIAQKFIDAYHQDMTKLNCLPPSIEPRVTECIPEIIAFVEELIQAQKAYVVANDVYFDLSTFPQYGKLSGKQLDDLVAGARVEIDERKRNPGDFVLWKGNEQGRYWKSPWGFGRPGWHIECSVMSKKYLGKTIDIHGGGMDLMFPHHENEIAQSEGLHNTTFARIWLHNAFININKEKMSKSLGNFITLQESFKTVDPMAMRFFILQHHYRTPIDFKADDMSAAQTAYKKICGVGNQITSLPTNQNTLDLMLKDPATSSMLDALCDDLNTPKCLGIFFEHLTSIKQNHAQLQLVVTLLQQVLGLTLQPLAEQTIELTPEIEQLIQAREEARRQKDWATSDRIRDELAKLGYQVQDKKTK